MLSIIYKEIRKPYCSHINMSPCQQTKGKKLLLKLFKKCHQIFSFLPAVDVCFEAVPVQVRCREEVNRGKNVLMQKKSS